MGQVNKALNRMSELAVSAQDSTKTTTDLSLYDKEFKQLGSYVTDIAAKDFNGVSLFNATDKQVTIDSDGGKFQMDKINLADTLYTAATSSSATGIATTTTAFTALGNVKAAITKLASDRAQEGVSMSRLNFSKDALTVQKTNIDSANSIISDVDVATESTNFARQNILVQSGTAMLAQANVQGQSVLRLLG